MLTDTRTSWRLDVDPLVHSSASVRLYLSFVALESINLL
jgi:hypothetical protein